MVSKAYLALWVGVGCQLLAVALAIIIPARDIIIGWTFLIGWALIPLAGYLEIRHVRRNSWWHPDGPPWVLSFLIPYANVVMAVLFAYFRSERLGRAAPQVQPGRDGLQEQQRQQRQQRREHKASAQPGRVRSELPEDVKRRKERKGKR